MICQMIRWRDSSYGVWGVGRERGAGSLSLCFVSVCLFRWSGVFVEVIFRPHAT